MKQIVQLSLLAIALMASFASCANHETDEPKPIDERKVLFLTNTGMIFDYGYNLVMILPQCTYANQIIAEGDDYFVSGTSEKERVGYWKNGKWSTLHVDFIDDINHWIDGMGKWDYYIYLLDYPNVLKNSGIFRLEDGERFLPGPQALDVSEGICYVIGSKITDESGSEYWPALYTEHKGVFTAEILPMFPGSVRGDCTSVYAYNRTHCLIGGSIDGWPVLWSDRQLVILPLTDYNVEDYEEDITMGGVESVTESNGTIYAVGSEIVNDKSLATMWVNGEIHHLVNNPDNIASEAAEVKTYGDDVYVLTHEFGFDEEGEFITTTLLWINGKLVKTYRGLDAKSFAVL